MIEFKNVSKTYDNVNYVLKDVNISIADGEFAFIVGHSGAGKTTLTKLLLREEKVSNGRLLINSYRLDKMPERKVPEMRRKMGFVFQDFRLFPNKTVFENVAFAMQVVGASKKSILQKVPGVVEHMGLRGKLDAFPSQLSGGEKQRVALARAVINSPDIVIADEPTGNIDPEMSYDIMRLLVDLNETLGKTVIVVTHEKELVDSFKKRVITLKDGMVESDRIGGMFHE